MANFIYIWTAEGWLYTAAVMDLYSRRIVGWSMQDGLPSQLVVDALMMAVWRRGKPARLLQHSDQESQHTSEHFQELLKDQGITCSMSRRRRGLGQLCHGKLLQFIEDRANGQKGVPVQGSRPGPTSFITSSGSHDDGLRQSIDVEKAQEAVTHRAKLSLKYFPY